MQPSQFFKKIAPGVYQIKETGGTFTTSVDRLLADGSMLSGPENAHLLATIDAIILGEYPTAPTTLAQQGTAIAVLLGHFGLLTQWMKVRGIHYFSHLTDSDLRSFIYDSSCGLDAVLKSQERLCMVLKARKLSKVAEPVSFSAALIEAGIPSTQRVRLPEARSLFEGFITSGDIPPCRDLAPKRMTDSLLWGRANTFQLLWGYRDRVSDGLSFEPSRGDIAKHIKLFGRPTGSTRTLPVDYICRLVGTAFTWLYEYGPLLVEVQRALSNQPPERKEREGYMQQALSSFNSRAESNGCSIRLQTVKCAPKQDYFSWQMATSTLLPTACFIICGIFSARRITELVSMRAQNLSGTAKTGYWISSYVGKRAKEDNFPCTQSFADSIRTLVQLMEIRGIDTEKSVFEAIKGGARLSSRLRNGVSRFGSLVNSEEAEQWQLAPHQFRKIFALIYRWRYDHPSLIALSVYFGHVNLKHIRAYTNSKEWKHDNQEAGKQFTLEKLRDIALEKVEPKGILGKSLKRAISRVLAQVELVDESEQVSALTLLIEHRQLELRATLWGYCGAKSVHSNLRRAACTTGDDIRSKAAVAPEKSSEEICAGCLFFATDVSRRVHWQEKAERLLTAANNAPADSMVKKKIQERQQIIERFARNNF